MGMNPFIYSLLFYACTDHPEWCSDTPSVTYADFGEAFMNQNCQGCHHMDARDRKGAPVGVHFGSVEDIWERKDDIVRVTLSEDADMPPSRILNEDEQYLLEAWLECGSLREDKQSLRNFNP